MDAILADSKELPVILLGVIMVSFPLCFSLFEIFINAKERDLNKDHLTFLTFFYVHSCSFLVGLSSPWE